MEGYSTGSDAMRHKRLSPSGAEITELGVGRLIHCRITLSKLRRLELSLNSAPRESSYSLLSQTEHVLQRSDWSCYSNAIRQSSYQIYVFFYSMSAL